MMATETSEFVADVFKQATDNFKRTIDTGVEFQEQNAKFWSDALTRSVDQAITQAEKVSKDVIPSARKNLEQFHDAFDEQAEKSLDMLRKTVSAGQDQDIHGVFDQTMKMWQASFDAVRESVDTVVRTNVEVFENLCELSSKACATNGSKTTQKQAAK